MINTLTVGFNDKKLTVQLDEDVVKDLAKLAVDAVKETYMAMVNEMITELSKTPDSPA